MSINNNYTDRRLLEISTESYNSPEEWEKARELNKEIVNAKMKNNDDGTESWVCKHCGHIIVMNINGNRAKMKVGKNTQVYVKFTEMSAWCEDCKEFNDITFSYVVDDDNNVDDTSFVQDKARGETEMAKNTNNDPHELERYLLKIK
jgi:hypothetical protein